MGRSPCTSKRRLYSYSTTIDTEGLEAPVFFRAEADGSVDQLASQGEPCGPGPVRDLIGPSDPVRRSEPATQP